MAFHLDFGKKGEEIAAAFLENKGYRILHRNWVVGKKEIDIIAVHKDLLVFAEVKTRMGSQYGWPEMAVGKDKRRYLESAARIFIDRYKEPYFDVRFDIIAITFSNATQYELAHFDDAF